MGDHTLAFQGESGPPNVPPPKILSQCNGFNVPLTLQAVPPMKDSTTIVDFEDCLDALRKGCGEGFMEKLLRVPHWGGPTQCCQPLGKMCAECRIGTGPCPMCGMLAPGGPG